MKNLLACLIALFALATAANANSIRIKDLVEFDGVRGNDLVGYGLVVGLNGTGDGIRNAPFTEDIMSNILERLGVNITGEQFRPKNVAAVFVTASLPPFARAGVPDRCDGLGDWGREKPVGWHADHDAPECTQMAKSMPSGKGLSSQAEQLPKGMAHR